MQHGFVYQPLFPVARDTVLHFQGPFILRQHPPHHTVNDSVDCLTCRFRAEVLSLRLDMLPAEVGPAVRAAGD